MEQKDTFSLNIEKVTDPAQLSPLEDMPLLDTWSIDGDYPGIVLRFFDGKADVERHLLIVGDCYLSDEFF